MQHSPKNIRSGSPRTRIKFTELPSNILTDVFRCIVNEPFKPRLSDLNDIFQLALTCRLMSTIILPFLWKDVYLGFLIWIAYPEKTFFYRAAVPLAVRNALGYRSPMDFFQKSEITQIAEGSIFVPGSTHGAAANLARSKLHSGYYKKASLDPHIPPGYTDSLDSEFSDDPLLTLSKVAFNSAVIEIEDDWKSLNTFKPIQFEKIRSEKRLLLAKRIAKYKQISQTPNLQFNFLDSPHIITDSDILRKFNQNLNIPQWKAKNLGIRIHLSQKIPILTSFNSIKTSLTSLEVIIKKAPCMHLLIEDLRKAPNLYKLIITTIGLDICQHTSEVETMLKTSFPKVHTFGLSSRDLTIADIPPNVSRLILRGSNDYLYDMAVDDGLFFEDKYALVQHLSMTEYGNFHGKYNSTELDVAKPASVIQFPFHQLKRLDLDNLIINDRMLTDLLSAVLSANQGLETFCCLYVDWSIISIIARCAPKLKLLAIMRSFPMDLGPDEPILDTEIELAFQKSLRKEPERRKSFARNLSGDVESKVLSASPLEPICRDILETVPNAKHLRALLDLKNLEFLLLSVRSDFFVLEDIHAVLTSHQQLETMILKVDQILPLKDVPFAKDTTLLDNFLESCSKGMSDIQCTAESMYKRMDDDLTRIPEINQKFIPDYSYAFLPSESDQDMKRPLTGSNNNAVGPDKFSRPVTSESFDRARPISNGSRKPADRTTIQLHSSITSKEISSAFDDPKQEASSSDKSTLFYDNISKDWSHQFTDKDPKYPIHFLPVDYLDVIAPTKIFEYYLSMVSTQSFPYNLYLATLE